MNDSSIAYIPFIYLQRSLRYWWFVVLLSLVGGAAGYLIHLGRSPEYESRAMITVGIDFSRTGYMTDIEEDQIIGLVGDVISSPIVMDQVEVKAREEGLIIEGQSAGEFLNLERWGFRWALRAKHNDADFAARLSNLWANIAMKALKESNEHAIIAEGLDRYILSLESCLQTLVTVNPVHGQCPFQNQSDLQKELEKSVAALVDEKFLSYGISPSVQLVLSENARVPEKPVRYGKNLFVFSGTILGLISGIILVEINLPGKFRQGA